MVNAIDSTTGQGALMEKTTSPLKVALNTLVVLASFALGGTARVAVGEVYLAPPFDVGVVGVVQSDRALEGETLLDVARRHDLGRDEVFMANPDLPHWVSIAGRSVVLPTRFVLPAQSRDGVIVNLPEKRLYWYRPGFDNVADLLHTHPVSIGQQNWTTPLGATRIVARKANPSWYPPESIRRQAEARGTPLPRVVAPGPSNPLGGHALYLDLPGYLIHGTNNPMAIGMRVTHGCIRMYPDDVASLFRLLPRHTPVVIVDEPVKVGWHAGTLYLEVHPPLDESALTDDDLLEMSAMLVRRAIRAKPTIKVLAHMVRRATERQDGIPVAVTKSVAHTLD